MVHVTKQSTMLRKFSVMDGVFIRPVSYAVSSSMFFLSLDSCRLLFLIVIPGIIVNILYFCLPKGQLKIIIVLKCHIHE